MPDQNALVRQVWTDGKARSELERLIVPGLLGFYEQCEVTHVFMRSEDRSTVSNVLTVVVFEEQSDDQPSKFRFLNDKPIEVKSVKDGTFGVARYRRPAGDLLPAIDHLLQSREWTLSGTSSLRFGTISSAGCQFVPPNAMSNIPWNLVLKNNFWNGSYVFEWADRSKLLMGHLFEVPRRIQDLSEEIQKLVPLKLASLSDKLGNLIIQLPVRVLISKFSQPHNSGDLVANVVWHPRASPRPLKSNCRFEFDSVVEGFAVADVCATSSVMNARAERGTFVATIWDEDNRVVLASTDTSAFVESIPIGILISDHEPRVMTYTRDGKSNDVRVHLCQKVTTVVGRMPEDDWNGGHTTKRMYRDEVFKLKRQRKFLHYNPRHGDRNLEHKRALDDIRSLINTHGEHGAWLWDPYLSAYDILDTLMYCQFIDVDLRGMGSAKEHLENTGRRPSLPLNPYKDLWRCIKSLFREPTPPPPRDYIGEQREILANVAGNWRGLRLEYRVRHGNGGWGFHDRFLIFPRRNRGALAWSLGTSVNSLGKEHHILQQVDDGQLVMDEFEDLWRCLDEPRNIVWKKP